MDWNIVVMYIRKSNRCHTLRGCVDWNCLRRLRIWRLYNVTPYVGVWIETPQIAHIINSNCHTLRGCVDWNRALSCELVVLILGHTLRGCVDWNNSSIVIVSESPSHTLRGCVDWNKNARLRNNELNVTPYVGVWIETYFNSSQSR